MLAFKNATNDNIKQTDQIFSYR